MSALCVYTFFAKVNWYSAGWLAACLPRVYHSSEQTNIYLHKWRNDKIGRGGGGETTHFGK